MSRFEKEYWDSTFGPVIGIITGGLSVVMDKIRGSDITYFCKITDTQTGQVATGEGSSKREASDDAWRILQEEKEDYTKNLREERREEKRVERKEQQSSSSAKKEKEDEVVDEEEEEEEDDEEEEECEEDDIEEVLVDEEDESEDEGEEEEEVYEEEDDNEEVEDDKIEYCIVCNEERNYPVKSKCINHTLHAYRSGRNGDVCDSCGIIAGTARVKCVFDHAHIYNHYNLDIKCRFCGIEPSETEARMCGKDGQNIQQIPNSKIPLFYNGHKFSPKFFDRAAFDSKMIIINGKRWTSEDLEPFL